MELRQDALAAAAAFILAVEHKAQSVDGLRATVGTVDVERGAVNVVPGSVSLSVDIRHPLDAVREASLADLLKQGEAIASRRRVQFHVDRTEHHPAVPADPRLTDLLASSAQACGHSPHRMVSGAGHDAAVLASIAPMTMLFVRSPGGISHHPEERVVLDDVRSALEVVIAFLQTVGSS
jgi:allantoate deiminase